MNMGCDSFSDFKLIEPLNRAVRNVGYTVPTPVQVQSIPPLLAGRDLLGCAQTGTGKTAAFALPILQYMAKNRKPWRRGSVRALIVTPTRELAAQIGESLQAYGKYLDVRSAVIFGGVGQNPQVKALDRGLDILVATPGRLLDLMGQGFLHLQDVEIFVLDEADRMLDMGFLPDIKRVLAQLPAKRQTMFFSATLPPDIVKLASTMVIDPVRVDVTPETPVVELIDQRLMYVDRPDKVQLLEHILRGDDARRVLVFSRTKHGANKIVRILERAGIRAEGIHGNKGQNARTKALEDFKAGRVRVLVATDIAARGIDVEGITHVINYDIPNVPETYVHRIGRTARAGNAGISISFCDSEERSYIRDIEKLLKHQIPVVTDQPYHSEAAAKSNEPPPKQGQRGPRPARQSGGRPSGAQGGRRPSGGGNGPRRGGEHRPRDGRPSHGGDRKDSGSRRPNRQGRR
jgi:ATP-dependent RNA helicase RhlE